MLQNYFSIAFKRFITPLKSVEENALTIHFSPCLKPISHNRLRTGFVKGKLTRIFFKINTHYQLRSQKGYNHIRIANFANFFGCQ